MIRNWLLSLLSQFSSENIMSSKSKFDPECHLKNSAFNVRFNTAEISKTFGLSVKGKNAEEGFL